ncbi:MAG: class I SAM-dependent methyltransferase [Solirubrobacterales bacterium]
MTAEDAGGELWDLQNLAAARRYCDWIFEQFEDAIAGSVAEIGAGIGTFSERILSRGVDRLLLVEPEAACMAELRSRFAADPRVELAAEEVPGSPTLERSSGAFDFVLCQNVLEHIPDHAGALRALAAALRPGGRLGLLVPANPRLFGPLDRAYGHERRYERDSLAQLVSAAGFEIDEIYPFNLPGVPAWWLKSRIGGPGIGGRSLRLYEPVVRAWRPVEQRRRPPVGLSLIVRARVSA